MKSRACVTEELKLALSGLKMQKPPEGYTGDCPYSP